MRKIVFQIITGTTGKLYVRQFGLFSVLEKLHPGEVYQIDTTQVAKNGKDAENSDGKSKANTEDRPVKG